MEELAKAGIEPVTDFAFEPIEAAALGWLAREASALALRRAPTAVATTEVSACR
jgi:hypothetical protein